MSIITDEPTKEAPDFREYCGKLSKIIINSDPRFTVGIYGDWGTGKTTLMQMIQEEIDENHSNIATTIWFDSWRYEREEYSLMIPLLRTIILTIENTLKNINGNSEKIKALKNVKKAFSKMMTAIARNLNLNLDFKVHGVGVGASLDVNKIIEDYQSDGLVRID